MDTSELQPNEEKSIEIKTDFGIFARYPVKTHVIIAGENLKEILDKYIMPYAQKGDMIFMSEKIVAISQGRAFDIDDIKPSGLAKFLCKFVYKSPYGIGLGSPWTMELAIRDIGVPKIFLAAFCSAVTKPFGIRGVFYKIVGDKGRAIDGPCSYTLPPYNHYAKLAPKDPDKVAKELKEHTGCDIVIIDANDIGREILGRSSSDLDINMLKQIFADNPLGQASQQTPLALVRKVD